MFFTINWQCSFPLHTLIADAIDIFGGYRVEIRQREGPLSGHKLDCPVIVSADNLDYQQSYSRVYSGNQSIGWH